MHLVYLTAKQYPGGTADHNYIRDLARAFYGILGDDFTFVVCNTKRESLSELPVRSISVASPLKRTIVFFFWIPWYWFTEGRGKQTVFFSNDLNILTLLIFWKRVLCLSYPIVSDWHLLTHTWKDRFVVAGSDRSITTSKKLERAVCALAQGVCAEVVHGGVDLDAYMHPADKKALRTELDLPQGKFLVGYVGLFTTMGMEKGISTMIGALSYLNQDIVMVFVGGKPQEIEQYEDQARSCGVSDRCMFVPTQPFELVVRYEQAMDVLVIPYPDKPHFREYGFPMKVYEYMASGVPIVYTKLELAEEVLSDCAFAVSADIPQELARMIDHVRNHKSESQMKAALALKKAKGYTWNAKAEHLLEIFAIMANMLTIPDNAVKYILFQRTEYLIYQNNKWINKVIIRIPFLTYDRMVAFEAWAFRRRIKRLFSEDMEREYASIKDILPKHPGTILDIGCGVAGIDCMISRHYAEKEITPKFYLLDKTKLDSQVYYGLEEKASFYNSLSIARALLMENGVDQKNIHTQEATPDNKITFPATFDLVVSLISWGFHYPVSTYLERVYEVLKPGGTLIIDIRKGSGGEDALRNKFPDMRVIFEGKKHVRILAHKA